MQDKTAVDWYFDFISPFSYLQAELLHTLPPHADIRLKPVLLAALLNHWQTKGPAEVEPKRIWTFEHCAWLAHKHGIPLKPPASHPFNPLPLLRLYLAAGGGRDAMLRIFRFVWRDGHLPAEGQAFQELLREFGVAPEQMDAPEIKQQLRRNGEEAIAAGVFGVPSAVVDNRCFWGLDATDMLQAWLRGDPFFGSETFLAARTMQPGIKRMEKT